MDQEPCSVSCDLSVKNISPNTAHLSTLIADMIPLDNPDTNMPAHSVSEELFCSALDVNLGGNQDQQLTVLDLCCPTELNLNVQTSADSNLSPIKYIIKTPENTSNVNGDHLSNKVAHVTNAQSVTIDLFMVVAKKKFCLSTKTRGLLHSKLQKKINFMPNKTIDKMMNIRKFDTDTSNKATAMMKKR